MSSNNTQPDPSGTTPESHAPTTGPPTASTLPKAYDPSIIEQRWADYWVRERLFDVPTPSPGAPGLDSETWEDKKSFTMLLPPPNVTGYLHMGHMFEHTESDILMRWRRMSGDRAVWVPGTDHAGIATQMLVERQLATEGITRQSLGPEAFTARVWEWKRQYGSAITDQMRRLGASVDWSREYFTMDDRLSLAVREAFVRLYEQGLIYRGAYIVNWDPVQQTAVSDLEVTHEERAGKLYHIRYPFADGTGSIVIATTRPETMLGDVAVAVNPTDPRYTAAIGRLLTLPLTAAAGKPDREIPVLADEWANPEFGTGAVKVTPAHDPNDFAIGQRHSLPSLTILDETAHVTLPGSPYHGLDRSVARQRIVEDLTAAGLLVAVKDHTHAIALSQRTRAVIEPRLSLQWFVAVNKPAVNKPPTNPGAPEPALSLSKGLASETWDGATPLPGAAKNSIAANAIDAVRNGHIRFTPEMYEKTYMEWMTNIHDWCISRQLWWGHRIPAWHCAACAAITVARDVPSACATCGSPHIAQSTDVLDTWFSSGLLPFTVFGWPAPEDLSSRSAAEGSASSSGLTTDLAAFYPTSLLVTGFDILFFWVARMIMLGCHFMLDVPMPDGSPRPLAEAVPFRNVYIHALVRDANREKMSKTKGNVVDPIDIIHRFGTDAVRFTLASMASPGTDIAFSEARTEGYRAFANKIWNAARFLFMNLDRAREAGLEIPLPAQESVISTGGEAGAERPPHFAHSAGAPSSTGSFIAGQGGVSSSARPPSSASPQPPIESRWILTRLSQTAAAANASLADYRFDEAANHIYQFFWGDLCDWYLEIVKLRLIFDLPAPPNEAVIQSAAKDPDGASPLNQAEKLSATKAATTAALTTLVAVFESALRLLSPFMPFLTEEIWHALYAGNPPAKSIALTRYPQALDYPVDPSSVTEMETLQELIVTIRALRKELSVPEKESTPIRINAPGPSIMLVQANAGILAKLCRVSSVEVSATPLAGDSARSTANFDVAVLYSRTIDIPAERERLTKEFARHQKNLANDERQLSNEAFMAKAPAHIVEGLRKQAAETRTLYDKTKAALDALN